MTSPQCGPCPPDHHTAAARGKLLIDDFDERF